MSAMNFRINKTRALVFVFLLLAAGTVIWTKKKSVGLGGSDIPSTSQTHSNLSLTNSSGPSAGSPSLPTAAYTASDQSGLVVPASNSLSWTQNMLELLHQVPRLDNAATRSFAIYMPSILCTSLSQAQNLGPSSLEADVPTKRLPHNERGLARIAQRCSEYKGIGLDKLRGKVIADLKTENAALTAFFTSSNGGTPEAARAHLTRALSSYDATALQPLAMVWSLNNTERLTVSLPDNLKPYAQGISAAAFDIALCRAGAYCGVDSIALDIVCVKFAECGATDVESAYRRLHNAAGISFTETDRMADTIRDAIKRRDAASLWPDSAGFPSARK
jgi:hypothetical protein